MFLRRLCLASLGPLFLGSAAGAQDSGKALRLAILNQDTTAVTGLAVDSVTVNAMNPDGLTPLMIAAALGNDGLCKSLIAAGAIVSSKTREKARTALMFAADFAHLSVVELLVAAGAAVRETDGNGYSAIDFPAVPNKDETKASEARALAVMRWLKTKGATIKPSLPDVVGVTLALGDTDLSPLIAKAKLEQ